MFEETPPPSKAQVQKLLDKLLPPNDEMDTASALLIIERSGADRALFSEYLKSKLERKVLELRSQELEVPPALLKLISIL